MTPLEMAKLHLLSGSLTRPWSAKEYKDLLDTDTIIFFDLEIGFLVGRIISPDDVQGVFLRWPNRIA